MAISNGEDFAQEWNMTRIERLPACSMSAQKGNHRFIIAEYFDSLGFTQALSSHKSSFSHFFRKLRSTPYTLQSTLGVTKLPTKLSQFIPCFKRIPLKEQYIHNEYWTIPSSMPRQQCVRRRDESDFVDLSSRSGLVTLPDDRHRIKQCYEKICIQERRCHQEEEEETDPYKEMVQAGR